jgi:hypothetical protein
VISISILSVKEGNYEATYLHLTVNDITTTDSASCRSWSARHASWWRRSIAPVSTALSIRAIFSHVASITANTTDDVCCEVALLWTIVLAMADLTAVLTSLIFIVTESSVKSSKLTKLVALELILAFRNRGSLYEL